jgi:hypothetical protein
MSEQSAILTATTWSALGGAADATKSLRFTAPGALPSAFPVTDLAAASIACAALAIAELIGARSATAPSVHVDRRLASFWFAASIRPNGWSMAPPWDPIAGDYRTNDGWIRLHTNAPHHRAAAERVLGAHEGAQNDRDAVATAVSRWAADDLETAIVDAGGCAARMRSLQEWSAHPQGRAVGSEPLARIEATTRGVDRNWPIEPTRPLAGIRVLDLTRVLAGPVATRFLAGFGADVLRIDPPDWNEPGVVPEVTLGKRCARLDLKNPNDRTRFHLLLTQADVLIHGYRANALERLGYDASARAQLNLGLVDVSLNAYGWSGPWRDRRGFDSLVQMSAGIADAGMHWKRSDRPFPLPVQALDHATGYLMAAAAVRGITQRITTGRGTHARLALARTAKVLTDLRDQQASSAFAQETSADRQPTTERTAWGDAQRLSPPLSIDGTPMHWDLPACDLGSAEARWR